MCMLHILVRTMLPQDPNEQPSRPPLQFGIRTLLGIMVAASLLFGTLQWLGVSPLGSAMVLVILVVSVAAAVGLVIAIAGATDDEQ